MVVQFIQYLLPIKNSSFISSWINNDLFRTAWVEPMGVGSEDFMLVHDQIDILDVDRCFSHIFYFSEYTRHFAICETTHGIASNREGILDDGSSNFDAGCTVFEKKDDADGGAEGCDGCKDLIEKLINLFGGHYFWRLGYCVFKY